MTAALQAVHAVSLGGNVGHFGGPGYGSNQCKLVIRLRNNTVRANESVWAYIVNTGWWGQLGFLDASGSALFEFAILDSDTTWFPPAKSASYEIYTNGNATPRSGNHIFDFTAKSY